MLHPAIVELLDLVSYIPQHGDFDLVPACLTGYVGGLFEGFGRGDRDGRVFVQLIGRVFVQLIEAGLIN